MNTDKPRERPVSVNLEDEMRKSYLDYAMSVIVGRALPDVRDGMKPVQRRILYSMYEQGNHFNRPSRKCARIVGDVIGTYHPHGDAAVYDALVNLAQDFGMRVPLVDGQGNFGSLDGDPPAHYRYTEAKLTKVAGSLLADIEKETVDFVANYDGQDEEPVVLPSRLPQLLVNGATGIAVGMATNIPPHNLGEIVDACVAILDNPDITLEELMDPNGKVGLIGPDFPTGGIIQGMRPIREAFETGRGVIRIRATASMETDPKGKRTSIIVTEVPYQVNKARMIEKIAALVRSKKLEGISDIRDESDRDGVRVVIELKRDAVAKVVLNNLYKRTPMQTSFGIIMLSLVDQRPVVMGVQEMLQKFLEFRREVVVRRARYELREAERRAHILEGFKKALDHLDEVIALIRASRSPEEARLGLVDRWDFSEVQAREILNLRLQRLTGLEREKILEEYREVLKMIATLLALLDSEGLIREKVKGELTAIKEEFADARRTRILPDAEEFDIEDLIAEEDMAITVTHSGYVKRTPISTYRRQLRGGKGRKGMTTREEDFVEDLFVASTHDYLLVLTEKGHLHWLKVYDLPEVGAAGKGKAIVNLVSLAPGDDVASLLKVREFEEGRYVTFVTRKGRVKRTPLPDYGNVRAVGIKAIRINEGDSLVAARLTDGEHDLFLATRDGLAIRFPESQVRPMARGAAGVKGINLVKGDEVIGIAATRGEEGSILTVSQGGYGKKTSVGDYRSQRRGGKGLINLKITRKNGPVVGAIWVEEATEVMAITARGKVIRTTVSEVPQYGRSTQGVRLMNLGLDDEVVGVATVAEEEAVRAE